MPLKILCPYCKNSMLYQPMRGVLGRKSCVYCGKSFKVEKERLVAE